MPLKYEYLFYQVYFLLSQNFLSLNKADNILGSKNHINMDDRNSYGRRKTACLNVIIDMNGSSDYLLVQAYIVEELGGQSPQVGDMSTFQAFKVIGA